MREIRFKFLIGRLEQSKRFPSYIHSTKFKFLIGRLKLKRDRRDI